MPVALEDRYIGHGQTGMRSNLRRFRDLERQSGRRVHTHVEIAMQFLFDPGDWHVNTLAWGQDFYRLFGGVVLDADTVDTSDGQHLFRVDTLTECEAEEGSFYWPLSEATPITRLYVHLAGDADPSLIEVKVNAIVSVWAGAMIGKMEPAHGALPILGRNLAVDGRLEEWTSETNLTNYTETLNGAGWTVNRDSTVELSETGSFSARCSSSGAAAGSAGFKQAIAGVQAGKMYLATALYRTSAANPTTAVARVAAGIATTLLSDGRTVGAAATLIDGVQVDPTAGEVRRHSFYFIAHEASIEINWRLTNSAASACDSWWDDIEVRRVHGFRLSHPRLGAATEFEEGASDLYPGTKTTGVGGVELINDSSAWAEGLFSADDELGPFFEGAKVTSYFGGVFQDGQEILREDMMAGGTGYVTRVSVTKTRAMLALESPQSILDSQLPTRGYPVDEYPDADPRIYDRARGLLFGSKTNITPNGFDFEGGGTGYREYEVADTTDAPDGIESIDAIYAYPDEEAAGKKDLAKRKLLIEGEDYQTNLGAGTFAINHDVRVFEVSLDNCNIDFDAGAGLVTASVAPGWYYIGQGTGGGPPTDRGLLDALADAMSTAAGVAIVGTYDDTTHLVTLGRGAKGTFTLYFNSTGTNLHSSIGALLGFDMTTDRTGSQFYVAEEPLFTDPDSQHVLRVDATGYIDDSAGTYTGTPGAIITKLADIARYLWVAVLGQPEPDAESFEAVRASHTEPLAGYLGALASVQGGAGFTIAAGDVFTILENGGFVELSFDGAGVLYCDARTDTPPANVDTLQEYAHLEELEGSLDPLEVYPTVRVNYDQDPSTGFVLGVETFRPSTRLLTRKTNPRTFDTWHTTEANASAALAHFAALARQSIRHFRLVVQGVAMRYRIGQLIQVSADQALLGVGEAGPGLDAVPFRIWRKRVRSDHVVELGLHTPILS